MATTTENLGLSMPELRDNVNLNRYNGNLEIIDEAYGGLVYRTSVSAGSSVTINNVSNGAIILVSMSSSNNFIGFKWNLNTIREVIKNGTNITVTCSDGNVKIANGGSSSTAYITIVGGCSVE